MVKKEKGVISHRQNISFTFWEHLVSREVCGDYTTLRVPSPGYELSFGTSLGKVCQL